MARSVESRTTADNYLLYWRNRQRVSLNQLSARVETRGHHFISPKTLNRWERGETKLPTWAAAELSAALKISEVELLHGPGDADPSLPTNVSAAYTGLDIEIADSIIRMGYTSWLASRPDDVRAAVRNVLPWLESMQRRSIRSLQASSGKYLLARGHELLGALALDQLENDEAIGQFRQALTISEELRDHSLIAAHMTQLGDAYRRKGDKDTALALMETALSRSRQAERATQGYVLEMIAYTYADKGDEQSFARHINEAIDLLAHSGEGEGAIQRDFIPFEVLEIYGKVSRDFGHPTQALEYLEQAEVALMSRPSVPRWDAVLTISKAQALCDMGELETGVELATRGLTMAHNCRSPRQMNRVRKLMRKLDELPTKGDPALAPLRDIVQDIYVGNRSPLDWHPQHAM